MPDVFVANHFQPPVASPVIKSKVEKITHEKDRRVLSSFRYYPEHANFVNMDKEEEVVLLLRRHFFTNVRWLTISLVALFVPILLKLFPPISFIPTGFQFILVAGWYVMVIAFSFEQFLNWFFNVNIITDERVVDVNFSNLVYREISEADLDQIQDVTVQVGSVIRTVFGYGNVYVQTASEVQRIVFEAVPHPDRAAKILRDLREAEERRKLN